MRSEILSTIDPGEEETWRGRLFVTIDVDWAGDEILAHTVDLLRRYALKCTFFATHISPLMRSVAADSAYEIGIHPNYNDLLAGTVPDAENASSFGRLRALFPEASAVRCHSLVQSSRLQNEFARCGFTHECNSYIPSDAGIELRPWTLWNGLIKVPFVWADDIHLYQAGAVALPSRMKDAGVCCVAFHPIHLFLNTDCVETYERYKAGVAAGGDAAEFVNCRRRGVRDLFCRLMDALASKA